MFHTIVSIKNDGHYFCRAGGNRPDGLNEPVTEKAAREFGVTQRTWHAWENAEQVDVTVWRTTQALSVRDLLPHMQGMRKADIIRRLENELGETAEDV